MSERRLRDEIRDAYLSKEPSPATLDRLKAMEAVSQRRSSWAQPRNLARLAAAAAVLLVAGLAIVFALRDPDGVAGKIAHEIAMNHNKQLDAEFATESYADLRQAMDRLDFALVDPGRIGDDAPHLVGARYCSIQGQLAAQLRLETAEGKILTLYQTTLTPALKQLDRETLRADGLAIELWHQDGVFFGLARGPDSL